MPPEREYPEPLPFAPIRIEPLDGALTMMALAIVLPVMKVAPVESTPPIVSTPVPNALLLVFASSVPCLIVTPPLNELSPPRESKPLPLFTKLPLPLRIPVSVTAPGVPVPPPIWTFRFPPRERLLARVRACVVTSSKLNLTLPTEGRVTLLSVAARRIERLAPVFSTMLWLNAGVPAAFKTKLASL